jgi:hypothetical protein
MGDPSWPRFDACDKSPQCETRDAKRLSDFLPCWTFTLAAWPKAIEHAVVVPRELLLLGPCVAWSHDADSAVERGRTERKAAHFDSTSR